MSHLRRNRNLGYRSLEARQMLAGDVFALEWGDHLYVRGDAGDNQIELVVNQNGQMEIVGLENTTINGSSDPFVVSGSRSASGSTDADSFFEGGLRVNMGPGHDAINVTGSQFDDLSVIYGGTGDDSVNLVDNHFADRLTVQTFFGDDEVMVRDTTFEDAFYAFTLDGEDTVMLDSNTTHGDAVVVTGNHDDHVIVNSGVVLGDVNLVLTLDGSDRVEVINPNVGEAGLGVFTGDGQDHVTAEFLSGEVIGQVIVSGQEGHDIGQMTVGDQQRDAVFARSFEADGDEGTIISGSDVEGSWWVFDRGDTTADADFQYRATAVEANETIQINSIDWVGSYFGSEAPESDNFVIEIFQNEAIESVSATYFYRQPAGEAIARFNVGNDANRIDTGEVWNDAPNFTEQDESGSGSKDLQLFCRN